MIPQSPCCLISGLSSIRVSFPAVMLEGLNQRFWLVGLKTINTPPTLVTLHRWAVTSHRWAYNILQANALKTFMGSLGGKVSFLACYKLWKLIVLLTAGKHVGINIAPKVRIESTLWKIEWRGGKNIGHWWYYVHHSIDLIQLYLSSTLWLNIFVAGNYIFKQSTFLLLLLLLLSLAMESHPNILIESCLIQTRNFTTQKIMSIIWKSKFETNAHTKAVLLLAQRHESLLWHSEWGLYNKG